MAPRPRRDTPGRPVPTPATAEPQDEAPSLPPDPNLIAVADLLREFAAGTPAAARVGRYTFRAGDRWEERRIDLPDGYYTLGNEWCVKIKAGRPFEAIHSDWPANVNKTRVEL